MNIVIMSRGKFPGLDGPYRRTKLLGAGFAKNVCDVTLIVAYPPGEEECNDMFFDRYGYRYIHTMRSENSKDVGFLKDIYYKIAGTFKVLKLFGNINRQKSVDVLFVSGVGFLELLVAGLLKRRYAVKIAIDKMDINYQFCSGTRMGLRGLLSGINIGLAELMIRRYVDIVFTISSYLKKRYDGKTRGLVKMSAQSLIESRAYDKADKALHLFSSCKADFKLLCVAITEDYFYGMFPFIYALSELRERYNFHLFILGSSEQHYLQKLNNTLKKYDMTFQTTILSKLTDEEVILLYKNADILLLAQAGLRTAEGGFPSKLSEYLISGRPIITTMFSDMGRYLEDGKNCLIVPYGDIVSYKKALCRLFEPDGFCASLGSAGRQTAVNNFDYIKGTKQVLEGIKEVLPLG